MDEIETRLKETSQTCFQAFETWHKNKKDSKARETLQEAIHELRKVASRLEIELAVSERDEMTQKPIPIPPHRDAKRRHNEDQDQDFNQQDSGNQGQKKGGPQNRKRGPRKSASGGGNKG